MEKSSIIKVNFLTLFFSIFSFVLLFRNAFHHKFAHKNAYISSIYFAFNTLLHFSFVQIFRESHIETSAHFTVIHCLAVVESVGA